MGKLSGLKEGLEKAVKALDMSQSSKLTGLETYEGFREVDNVYDNIANIFEAAGVKAKISGSAHSGSRYIKLVDSVSGTPFTIRVSDHPQSGHALNLHGPADFNIGEFQGADSNSYTDAISAAVDKINEYRQQFGDELLNISSNAAFDPAKKESSNLLAQYAPLAVGAGAAGLAMTPQESQAASNRYMQMTRPQNAIMQNLENNLQQFGTTERGVPVTGQMRATPHPLLMRVADKLRIIDTPIGPVFGGAADYLDKLGAGESVDYWDRLGAVLDVIP